MVYSYTQISHYLRCPRSYRYRYLDGWQEKETRAAMAFGRCFEKALAAYFCGEDCSVALFKEWEEFRDFPFKYKKGESGIAWYTRVSTCSSDSCRTIESAFLIQRKISRSKSPGHSEEGANLLATLMPSANWTANTASWTGRPHRVATRRVPMACYRSTRS
jgi:hypothetical protein